jgi:uncharacterized membrane protein
MSGSQPGPELRIGDSEREAAVAALGDHYAAGRLTKEEYDERAARAWEARTRSALWPLFSDLPHPQVQRPTRDTSGSTGPGWRPGASGPHWGWRFGGLLPVLVIVGLFVLFTHFWVVPLVLLAIFVFKFSQYRGYSHRGYSRRYHHDHGWR